MVSARARKAAEAQAAKDREALAQLEARKKEPRKPTIGDNFVTTAHMIATARAETRLSEATLLKIYELNLMWALNNRQSVEQSVFSDEELEQITGGGEVDETGDESLPEPHEVITAEPDDKENPNND